MTRLRKMMLEELQRRNYSTITTRNYLRVVADFAKYFGKSPDKLGPNELRTYQAYLLQDRKLTPGTVVNWVAALRFFFVKTLKLPSVPRVLALSPGPATTADGVESGRSLAPDQCGNSVFLTLPVNLFSRDSLPANPTTWVPNL